MKKVIKILLINLLIFVPLTINAATLDFSGESIDNSVTYDIVYNPESEIKNTIMLEISKTNDDLNYELTSEFGTCNGLECTLITEHITTEVTIASLKITNNTKDVMETTITINGTIPGATKTVTLDSNKEEITQVPLSDDTNLSNLTVSTGTLDQTFSKDITSYNVTGIKDTINSIRITPDCEKCSWEMFCPNGDCSIKNINQVQLQLGVNKVSIVVTSEDLKNNKTYLLTIYRGEIELNSPYLEDIKINNGKLSPNFESMTNDYTVTIGKDVDSLDIETIAEDPNANIVIKGNENFKVGENTVTITVTSNDGQNKQVYTIVVTKTEEEKEEIKDTLVTNKVEKKENNTLLIILLSSLGLILIIVAYIIIFKKKKNKKDSNKNNKNDKNNKLKENYSKENKEERKKTTKEKIDEATRELIIPTLENSKKQDIDEALEDLMKTKQLELDDLDI